MVTSRILSMTNQSWDRVNHRNGSWLVNIWRLDMTIHYIMTRLQYWYSASFCYMDNCFIDFSSVIGWYTYNKYTGRSNRDIVSEEDACALIAWSLGN